MLIWKFKLLSSRRRHEKQKKNFVKKYSEDESHVTLKFRTKKGKKNEDESKKLERNEETKAPNERKQQIRFAGAKISPQGLEPWSTYIYT